MWQLEKKTPYIVESYLHKSFFINHRQTQILYNAPLRGTTADINKADLALFIVPSLRDK